MKTLLSITVLIALMITAKGRQIQPWPYEKLADAADLVAIVKLRHTRGSIEQLKGHRDPKRYSAHLASFDILWMIKGGETRKIVEMLYFTYFDSDEPNGALFISFENTGEKQYLVFLKERQDGVFVPVTGDYDAAISVKVLRDDGFSTTPEPEVRKAKEAQR